MIEFSGELSEKYKNYIRKIATKVLRYASLILAVVICVPLTIIAVVFDISILYSGVASASTICAFVFIFSSWIATKIVNPQIPTRLTINDGIITKYSEHELTKNKPPISKNIEDVKEVVDRGEWYEFSFVFSDRDIYFVCQKDLITKGTLADFEKLFKNIITHKPSI
jgi:hypothetical protein